MTSLFHAAEAIRHTPQTIYANPSSHLSLDIILPFPKDKLMELHVNSSPLVSLSDIIYALSETQRRVALPQRTFGHINFR